MALTATDVQKLYLAYFGRPADPVGLAYWQSQTLAAAQAGFGNSAEYTALYANMTEVQRVSQVYQNLLGRAPDQAGLLYWAGELTAGRETVATLVSSMQKNAQAADITTINNRVTYATAFTAALDTASEIVGYSGTAANVAARSAVSTITSDAATLTAAQAALDSTVAAIVNGTYTGSGGVPGAASATVQTTLTVGQDVLTLSSANDVIRGVAGATVGVQDQTTLNSSDIIDGGTGNNTLVVNLVNSQGAAVYQGGARIKNVQTLQLGTDNTNGATFDYNVNMGTNEITEVTKIIADQINSGGTAATTETLTVRNVLKTNGTLPTLAWVNDSNMGLAGQVVYNARAAESGLTADTLRIELSNVQATAALNGFVNNGVLDISGSNLEAVVIESKAGLWNTLNNSTIADTWPDNGLAATNNAPADIVGARFLSKVTLTNLSATGASDGATPIGVAPGVNGVVGTANAGLTTRDINSSGSDGGATINAIAATNLLSVEARVTEVDATNMAGAANVRFTAKTNGAETNVTFKGGAGNDYVEFEVGNVSVTGGAGNDTFAFLNNGFNSTFTTADSIVGGAGTDTIQLGVNGGIANAGAVFTAATYNIDWTEFNNKTGIDVLDLRGTTNTVTLSDAFVAGTDAAGGMVVRTDRIVQTSATDPTNFVGSLVAREDNSVNTINLTKLAANRQITFEGGSGSDRLVLNEQSFTDSATLHGGTNANIGAAAVAGDYDTLTVVDNAVLSRGDLSKTTGFEGMVLVKSDNLSTRQFNIELTEAFLLGNTQATNDVTLTNIDDTVFQIGTAANANCNALTAGDTVIIDISDLFLAGAYKATLAGRAIDVTTLQNAIGGANVTFTMGNGVAATAAQIAAVLNHTDVTGQTAVIGASGALPPAAAAAPLFFTGTVADEAVTLAAATNSVSMNGGSDTVTVPAGFVTTGTLDGGTGTDTLVLGAGATINGAASVTGFEILTLAGAASMTAAQYNAFTGGTTAGSGADILTITDAGTIVGDADIETITFGLAASTNQITLAGATAQAINGNTGNDAVVTAAANLANKTIALGTGSDVLTVLSNFGNINFSLAAAGAAGATVTGVETVTLQAGIGNGGDTLTMFNGAAILNLTTTAVVSDVITLGTGGQTVNVSGNTAGTYTITTNAANADVVDLTNVGAAGGAITVNVAATSLITNMDTIIGFRAGAGVDVIDTTTGITGALTNLVIATADVGTLAAAFATAINADCAVTAAHYNAVGDAYLLTVSAGTGAGTYLVVNEGATDAAFTAAEDVVVKLVGMTGILIAADVV